MSKMPEETTGNECPRCKQNSMRIITQPNGTISGICHNCGKTLSYSPPGERSQRPSITQLLQRINEYSFLIAIVAMIIAISSLSNIGNLSTYTTQHLNILDDQFNEKFEGMNNTTSTLLSNHTIQISNNTLSLLALQTQLSSLSNIQSNISIFNSSLQTTINRVEDLELQNFYQSHSNLTLTITEFPLQNDTTRYAHLNVSILSTNNTLLQFNETRFYLSYPNSNISLLSYNTKYIPYTYQPIPSYLETHLFEKSSSYTFRYNLTWDTSHYNTSSVTLSSLDSSLCLDSMYFDFKISKTL
jgi:hypothetical protein